MPHLPKSRVTLPPGPWPTVLAFLAERFPAIPLAEWAQRMARGLVDDGDAALDLATPYRPGATVFYRREVPAEPRVPFEETLVYVDDDLVVADKPHFLAVMPAGAYVEETLSVRLARRLGNPDLVALHRLDRATAGLVVFSARPSSRDAYTRLFRERRIEKTYEALAPPLPGLTFPYVHESRLERGEPFFRMQEVPGEPNARTVIEVLERGEGLWRYRLQPVTGRKHQLRVHMAALGAPIAGDVFYPTLRDEPPGFAEPMCLLARELFFIDPLSGAERVFRSERGWEGSAKMPAPPPRSPG
ncbi:MAG TPA: pseudouridine synthase [Luteibacter sp.]|uniref:pseudouridine synthase n=1 Tax=Luteibacter sp. TaxID=1886636 RepID=UPI002F3FDCBE